MELLLRLVGVLLRIISEIVAPVLRFIGGSKRTTEFPQIQNEMLEIAAVDLAERIRNKELRSEDVVRAYISRIKEVNPLINAVVEERFADAIEDAKKADTLVATSETPWIVKNYPLLGVPFTVKESCGLKGSSLAGASLPRAGIKCAQDGVAVANLKAAGCIPLLVSNTPEYCLSWESYNHITGRSLNPYDNRRTPGGSSGGEGALLGAGASLFGVGSDIAGSIRVPAMFCGVFGHKPTSGAISIKGHFPMSSDDNFQKYLTVGPMCRYAKDLPTLLHVMSGDNAKKLRLDEVVHTKNIKIYYMEDVGFSLAAIPVEDEIKIAMFKAIQFFKHHGISTEKAEFSHMDECVEIALAEMFSIEELPELLVDLDNPKQKHSCRSELVKALFGRSKYTFAAIFFYSLVAAKGFVAQNKVELYKRKEEVLRKHILETLGEDGVFFFPTFPVPALRHYDSFPKISGVMYTMIFNVLGFPATHVPLGFDKNGLPIGMQVVAAPYQDRLCLCIARELEAAFGGWKAPQ